MLQLLCVELGWKQCTLADAALIQSLLPCLLPSIGTTSRHLRKAFLAFRTPYYIPVPFPHTETVGVERRAWQCVAAGDTIHISVVVEGRHAEQH